MSANSRPIQTLPPGFLNMLRLKNRGNNPDELIGTVQPTMDMTPWYLNALFSNDVPVLRGQESGVRNGGFFLSYGLGGPAAYVPDGEWWYVHHYGVEVGVPAGSIVSGIAPQVLYGALGGISTQRQRVFTEAMDFIDLDGTQSNVTYIHAAARDFWLAPGTLLGTWTRYMDGTAGVIDIEGYVIRTALRI